mgnify:CR=1 FL=1
MSNERVVVGRGDSEIEAVLDGLLEDGQAEILACEATPEKIAALRSHHVTRYRRNLDAHYRYVNVAETERLLSLWTEMGGKSFSELSDDQKLEVLDAIAAEVL